MKHQLKRHAPKLKISFRPADKVSSVFTDMNTNWTKRTILTWLIPSLASCVAFNTLVKRHVNYANVVNSIKSMWKMWPRNHERPPWLPMWAKLSTNFSKVKVLKKVRNRGLLKLHEANFIILNEGKTANFKKDAKHVSPVFYNLIKKKMIGKRHPTMNPTTLQLNETSTFTESEHCNELLERITWQ